MNKIGLKAIIDNLYSSITDGLVMIDMKGTIIESNQAFSDMLGYSMDELKTMTYQDITPQKWWEAEKDIVEFQVLVRGYSDAYEKEYIKKTGEIFPVSIRVWLIKDAQGNPLGMWGMVRDITESKQAEENISVLNAQLHEHIRNIDAVNNELQALSYSVSHDLRAPLRAMEGFSKILLEDQADKLDDKGKDYLNRISAAARSMDSLINSLLTLARIARAPCKKEPFDLSALAQEVVNGLVAANPGSRVECRIAPGMRAYGDVPLCTIVLENLLGNAWKFTSKVRQPVVEVGTMEKGKEIVYFVRDNGAGFDMAYANKLFTPFQRLHPAAEYQGAGIGLASVLRIINRHGGDIWAEGNIDEGATFYFTL